MTPSRDHVCTYCGNEVTVQARVLVPATNGNGVVYEYPVPHCGCIDPSPEMALWLSPFSFMYTLYDKARVSIRDYRLGARHGA